MKKLFLSFLILNNIFMAVGQELGGFYKQSIHPEGLLYFIFPQQMPASKNRKSIGKKALSYDYTYLDSRDSVTLLMTMNTTEPFIPDSLIISEIAKILLSREI